VSTPAGRTAIGAGTLVSGEGFAGVTVRAETVSAVLDLLTADLADKILLTDQASATAFAPILPRLRGVICTQGGEAAHLAIVSRGLGLPCVMQARLDTDVPEGTHVEVDASGAVWTASR
jgi:phosphohistidine swiveling domain-containing protein